MSYLYLLKRTDRNESFKIGVSGNPTKRFLKLTCDTSLIDTAKSVVIKLKDAYVIEHLLHKRLRGSQIVYDEDGGFEWFSIDRYDEVISMFINADLDIRRVNLI